ncbi:MAG TPA: ABC transporter permease subunit [Streptosporangiaceae bacterium]|nr:ABC transporter permease subunit [Streptosporangiaceae bacterium]
MTTMSAARTGAVIRKELTEFRRSRFIVSTMAIIPAAFFIAPTAEILAQHPAGPSASLNQGIGFFLAYLLLIPVLIPATIVGYSVVGEREQGTLEPLLTTPIRREELLIGKAVATLIPAAGVSYLVLGIFLVIVQFGASPVVATAVLHSPYLLAQVFFIPLLAAWAIWIGLAISSRASDIRVAQQLSVLASLPPVALTLLLAFQVVHSTLVLAASLAGALLVIDCAAYLLVSRLFDRERLVIGARPGTG